MNNVCRKCQSSFDDIKQSGFVGCEECYQLDEVKNAVNKLFDGRKHKGRNNGDDYEF